MGEIRFINKAYEKYDDQVKAYFKERYKVDDMHLVHTCTAALEAAALALAVGPGDEIIMPSFTYVSTANAFALRGATIVYCDVDETMNMDVTLLENLITSKTKVIVPVHYGGYSCDMNALMDLANHYNLKVVEDAAQSINSFYDGKMLGTIGHIGCISFHHTKNIHCFEGGALLVNDPSLKSKIDHIVEKGTNRIAFEENKVSSYTWKTLGSSYLMDELRKKVLYHHLLLVDDITSKRQRLFNLYDNELKSYKGHASGNGHLFFIMTKNHEERQALKTFLSLQDIDARSHYEPLHLSSFGKQFCTGPLPVTEKANCLLRLPLHESLEEVDIETVIKCVKEFYHE